VSVGRNALLLLSTDDLIALVLAQAAQIGALVARVGELEARLNAPPKTPDNSSTSPMNQRWVSTLISVTGANPRAKTNRLPIYITKRTKKAA